MNDRFVDRGAGVGAVAEDVDDLGGRLDIGGEEEDGRVEIALRGQGPRVVLDAELRNALIGMGSDSDITPRAAGAFLAAELVRQSGGSIQVSQPDEETLLFGATILAS